MSEELGEVKETPDQAKFRAFVTSPDFIQSLPGITIGKESFPPKLVSHDDTNRFAIAEIPRHPDTHDKSFKRCHFISDPATGEYTQRGYVDVTNNSENLANRNIYISKFDEDHSLQQYVSTLVGPGYERMDVGLSRPGHRTDRRPVIEISTSFVNNQLDAFKYIPRSRSDENNPGQTVFDITRKEIDVIAKEKSSVVHTVDDKKCSFEVVEEDGVKKLKVNYAVSGGAVEGISIPLEISIEDKMHELVPQDVQRFPEKAPTEADLWMEKDIPSTLFGEGWLQPA